MEIIPTPRIQMNDQFIIAKILPYTLQRLKMWGYSVVNGDDLYNYVIKLNQTTPVSTGPRFSRQTASSSGNTKTTFQPVQQNLFTPLTRLDLLCILFGLADKLVLDEIFRILTQFPMTFQ